MEYFVYLLDVGMECLADVGIEEEEEEEEGVGVLDRQPTKGSTRGR
jgi:hypothetical protein